MLENFHLAAITKADSQTDLLRIPLHQNLQTGLSSDWQAQYDAFVDDTEKIDFNAGYKPEKHERFRIANYDLPDFLQDLNSQNVNAQDAIMTDDSVFSRIQGIVAMARNEQGEEIMLFQNFSNSRVIRPRRVLLVEGSAFRSIQRPGLTLEGSLSAVYDQDGHELCFRSFRTVNTFLPLSDYYKEASEQEIREVLSHQMLAAEDIDVSVAKVDQWFRKRYAMLRDSKILDDYSATEIQLRSHGHNVSIEISNGKIIFPADKAEAKRVLQFLNEELYKGPITDTLYETNSKKETPL